GAALAVRTARSYGAAVLVADGVALTAWHAVEDGSAIEARFDDGEWELATLMAKDEATDLALLQVASAGRPPARLASSRGLSAGAALLAVGSPREMGFSVSRGSVAYAGREMNGIRYLQTDIAANPGSSGGPVVDARGAVIGVMSFVLRDSTGIAFAIPVDYAAARFPEHIKLRGPA